MRRLGLTGGIATGKSTVAEMLRELGFDVLSADRLAHQLIEPGQPAYEEVLREFGPSILNSSGLHTSSFETRGKIDRGKLGALVFADPAKLARLNAIIHPRVEAISRQQLDEWARSGSRKAAFIEAALLVEAGYDKFLDGLVVTGCRPEQQLERLRTRGFSEEEARRRIAAQLPMEEKMRHAQYRIDCSGSIAETRRQVGALAHQLLS
jgi:dephospho-CoA kinase